MALTCFDSTFTFFEDGGDPSGVIFAEVIEITLNGGSVTAINTSHLTTTERWKTFAPGFKDPGEITFKANFDIAEYEILLGSTGNLGSFTLTLPEGSTVSADGFISKVPGIAIPEDDRITTDFTFKVSGQFTIVEAP